MDELIAVLPRTMILPRTFILHSEESLLVAGVAQIDVISLPVAAKPASDRDYPQRRPCALVSYFGKFIIGLPCIWKISLSYIWKNFTRIYGDCRA